MNCSTLALSDILFSISNLKPNRDIARRWKTFYSIQATHFLDLNISCLWKVVCRSPIRNAFNPVDAVLATPTCKMEELMCNATVHYLTWLQLCATLYTPAFHHAIVNWPAIVQCTFWTHPKAFHWVLISPLPAPWQPKKYTRGSSLIEDKHHCRKPGVLKMQCCRKCKPKNQNVVLQRYFLGTLAGDPSRRWHSKNAAQTIYSRSVLSTYTITIRPLPLQTCIRRPNTSHAEKLIQAEVILLTRITATRYKNTIPLPNQWRNFQTSIHCAPLGSTTLVFTVRWQKNKLGRETQIHESAPQTCDNNCGPLQAS